MEALEQEEYITIRMNGGIMKHPEELKIEQFSNLTLKEVLKSACEKFGDRSQYKQAKIYNKDGVHIFEGDFNLIASGDCLYVAMKGEEFNFCAILDDYELGKTLGIGGFGKVVLGKHREKKNEVAIKFTDVGDQLSSANLIQQIYKEAESLKSLQHKNIVQLYSSFIEGKQFIMIQEAAQGGELYQYLKKHKVMNEPIARGILKQIVQAMLYCHSRGVVHRDLKLENVLFKNKIEDDFSIKVIDFGIAGMSDDKVDAGTLAYMAPECLDKVAADTSPAIDVWAIGIMFYCMVYGTLPFIHENEKELVRQIRSDSLKFPKNIPFTAEGKEVIKSMMYKDPTKRVTLLEFVQQPYMLYEEEEFEQKYEEIIKQFEEQKEQDKIQEEQKLQEKFIQSLDFNNDNDKDKKKKTYTPNTHNPSPRGGKKKKKSKKD